MISKVFFKVIFKTSIRSHDFFTKIKTPSNKKNYIYAVCIQGITKFLGLMVKPNSVPAQIYQGYVAYTGTKLQTKERTENTTPLPFSPPSPSIKDKAKERLFFSLSPDSSRCCGFYRQVTEGRDTLFLSFGTGK